MQPAECSRDGSGLYVARQADDRVEKYVSGSNGDLQANPLLIRQLSAPRSMCVSADSKLMGIAAVAEVGVLGKPGCNLVNYCRPCLDVPAWNATFYRQCEWRCIGGFYFTETADGSAAGEPGARVLPSTGRAGYCQECPAGTYSEFASARFLNISDCTACPLGKYRYFVHSCARTRACANRVSDARPWTGAAPGSAALVRCRRILARSVPLSSRCRHHLGPEVRLV